MIHHQDIYSKGFARSRRLAAFIKQGTVKFAGNRKLKIYGTLSCASGKRMKISNRVFFASEQEALDSGYRPCGHCMRSQYLLWQKIK